jgi:hypothetical protein
MGASWVEVDRLIREVSELGEFPHAEALEPVLRAQETVALHRTGRDRAQRLMAAAPALRAKHGRSGNPRRSDAWSAVDGVSLTRSG